MDVATPPPLFPSVLEGLQEFHDRISGDAGSYRVALLAPGQASGVLEVATSIMQVVRDVLLWLRDGLAGLSERLISIDALLALVETLGTLLGELGTALDPATLALPVPGLAEVQGGVTSNLVEIGDLLANGPSTAMLPGPETFAALEDLLQDLVGPIDEEHTDADVLGELLTQLQGIAAE